MFFCLGWGLVGCNTKLGRGRASATQPPGSSVALAGVPFPGFGNLEGILSLDLFPDSPSYKDAFVDIEVQKDGKILMAGWGSAPSFADAVVVRTDSNGSLDPTFGNGTGMFRYERVTGLLDLFHGVELDGDRIVAFGTSFASRSTSRGEALIVALDGNGVLDASFASGGVFLDPIKVGNSSILSLKINSDRKIVALASAHDGTGFKYFLIQLTSDGRYDATFGQNGVVELDATVIPHTYGAIRFFGDQIYILATLGASRAEKQRLYRVFAADGTLDSSFGGSGKIDLGDGNRNWGSGLAVNDLGVYVASNYESSSVMFHSQIRMFDHSGVPSSDFGLNGRLDHSSDFIFGSHIQQLRESANRIYAVGGRMMSADVTGLDSEYFLDCISPSSGSRVESFGNRGRIQGASTGVGRSVRAIAIDGDVLWAAGHSDYKSGNGVATLQKLK